MHRGYYITRLPSYIIKNRNLHLYLSPLLLPPKPGPLPPRPLIPLNKPQHAQSQTGPQRAERLRLHAVFPLHHPAHTPVTVYLNNSVASIHTVPVGAVHVSAVHATGAQVD